MAGTGTTGPGRMASAGLAPCAWMSQLAVLIVCQTPFRSGLPFTRGTAGARVCPVNEENDTSQTVVAVARTRATDCRAERMEAPPTGDYS